MRTSSKGASEKRRLTQYVTNTVLDDNFKGTTEQFVLHFNEVFRQFDDSEKLVELWVISLLEIGHKFPLIAVDINELLYLCRSERAVFRLCYSYC